MFFLTVFKICENNRTIYPQVYLHFGIRSGLRFAASSPEPVNAGVFYSIAFKPIKAWFLAPIVCRSMQSTRAEPRRKDIAMTEQTAEPGIFDAEQYRDYLAPLELSREQEDELLRDLWAITETLVDQSFSDPLYPQQFAIAAGAFRALDEAVALASKEAKTTKPSSHPRL